MITKTKNYYHMLEKIQGGYPQHYLFTKDELIEARRRALKNSKEIPKKGLISWFKSLF